MASEHTKTMKNQVVEVSRKAVYLTWGLFYSTFKILLELSHAPCRYNLWHPGREAFNVLVGLSFQSSALFLHYDESMLSVTAASSLCIPDLDMWTRPKCNS